jgi:hypothetical protein
MNFAIRQNFPANFVIFIFPDQTFTAEILKQNS